MCYEFSEWFTKSRSAYRARQQEPKTEARKEPAQRVPEPQPVVAETRVKERDPAPA